MVLPVLGQPADAVIAVAQDLDAQLVVFLRMGGRAAWYQPPTHQLGPPPQLLPSLSQADLDPRKGLQRPAGTQIIGFSIPTLPPPRARPGARLQPGRGWEGGGGALPGSIFATQGRASPTSWSNNILTSSSPFWDAAFGWSRGRVVAETWPSHYMPGRVRGEHLQLPACRNGQRAH